MTQAGGFNINVQMKATIGGEEYTFTDVLKLSVSDPAIATKVLIDGTHYNDYVNGYYSGNMTNFINMGTADNIQVRIAQPGEDHHCRNLGGCRPACHLRSAEIYQRLHRRCHDQRL